MMVLVVLILGGVFSFFTCAGLGANGTASSWAATFGSKTLLMKQVIFSAVICECAGAFFLGNRQTDTLFKSIVKVDCFKNDPDSLMIALMCASFATAFWNCISCRWALPVATTHSLIGAMIGVGMAHGGMDCVNWSTKADTFPYYGGVKAYVISWMYSPVLAAAASCIFITILRHVIFYRKNVTRSFNLAYPFIVYSSFSLSLLHILLKLAGRLGMSHSEIIKVSLDSALVVSICSAVLVSIFELARSSHIYWKAVAPDTYWGALNNFIFRNTNYKIFIDDAGGLYKTAGPSSASRAVSSGGNGNGVALTPLSTPMSAARTPVAKPAELKKTFTMVPSPMGTSPGFGSTTLPLLASPSTAVVVSKPQKEKFSLRRYFYIELNKTPEDIVRKSEYIKACQDQAEDFDPNICLRFRHLLLIVVIASSIAHGAKDIENCVGCFMSMYYIHMTGKIGKSTHLETSASLWILGIGTLGLGLGTICYSYRVTSALGVELGKLTPGRGLCVHLSSTLILVLGLKFNLTLSYIQCVFGALVGMASMDGMGAMNWLVVSKVVMAWVLTLCICSVVSGALYSAIQHIRF